MERINRRTQNLLDAVRFATTAMVLAAVACGNDSDSPSNPTSGGTGNHGGSKQLLGGTAGTTNGQSQTEGGTTYTGGERGVAGESQQGGTSTTTEVEHTRGGATAGSTQNLLELASSCSLDTSCKSGHCADGYCCESECAATCSACNLPTRLGICSPVATGDNDANTCADPKQACSAGQCLQKNGISCTSNAQCVSNSCVDGVCCNLECNGTCQSCRLPNKFGTCALVPNGDNDPGTCSAPTLACNDGLCIKKAGASCSSSEQCLTNICVDGVCCDLECNGTCQSCNLPDRLGTCSLVPNGSNDPGTCSAPTLACVDGLCQ